MLHTQLVRPLADALAVHASERGVDVAFRDEDRAVTWAELESRTARLAAHLRNRVERGHTVAICMGNRVEAVESYLGVTRSAAVGAFLNPRASDGELAYLLEDCRAEVLITDGNQHERTRHLAERAPTLREVIVVDASDANHSVSYERLVGSASARAPDDLGLDQPAWMLYTSGTTGRPKGVVLTQRSCLYVVAACWAPALGLSAEDEILSALPLFHSYALDLAVVASVATGAGVRLLPRFSTDRTIEILRTEPVTVFAGVPTMFHYLVEQLGDDSLDARSLRICVSAGAIMPGALNGAFERRARVPLLDGYGITETSTMVTISWPTGDRPSGSCGLPLPGCAVRIVEPDTGRDVDRGQEGELIVRGPQVMLGYHNRPDDTAEALRDGWYHSGDLARSDAHGYLTITGRLKELIIRGGENIYPAEVEQAVVEHPGIVDAAVVGMPDAALGEKVAAFVVAHEGQELDWDEARSFVAERIADFKVPAEFELVSEIPRTGSGKVMRHRLRTGPDEAVGDDAQQSGLARTTRQTQ